MDEIYSRQTPHSTEAEQAVLGSMLIDSRCVADVIEKLRPEDFYVPLNRELFETIYAMFTLSQTIDPVTVLNRMQERGAGGEPAALRSYVVQLMEMTPTAANVGEYIAIVRDKSVLRAVAQAAGEITELIQEGTGEADEILEVSEQKIYAVRQGRSSQELLPVSAILIGVYEELEMLARNGGKIPGLPTGFPDLDEIIAGLNNSDLILIAARPGMGKTAFGLNIALHAAKTSGKTAAIFNLEMGREQLVMRLLSSEGMVELQKLITGRLEEEDWQKIARAAMTLSKADIRVDDNPSITVPEMKAKCRRLENLGLIVIDYLQLMQSAKKSDNRTQEVAEISRSLKIMAKELNVPVVCLSQLNRAAETRADKRPMLSDLRESGAIEQDADIVMFLYRDDYYNEDTENQNVAECSVAKNRHGKTGKVELQWLGQYTLFSSREWRYDDRPGS